MMDKYKDASLPIEERVADLLSRMTLEEKIMQTDQYSIIGDYTKRDAEERVEEFRWEEFEEAIKDRSVGSVQFRSASPQPAKQLQRYAVEKTRLGIPFLFSEEALHGFMTAMPPASRSRSAWLAPLNRSWDGGWGAPSGRKQGPAGFTKPGIL